MLKYLGSFWNHDLKSHLSVISVTHEASSTCTAQISMSAEGSVTYLPEGRQHTVIEIPGGCEIWVLSICRVETPCSLGRQHDTARHKMTHPDAHAHNTHIFGRGNRNRERICGRCVAHLYEVGSGSPPLLEVFLPVLLLHFQSKTRTQDALTERTEGH